MGGGGSKPAAARSSAAVLALLIVCVIGATLAAHWPVLSAQAILFDDGEYLTENPLVQNPSLSAAGRFLREVLHPSTVQGYYQPLPMISLMIDYAIGGRPDDLRAFHRTALILHAVNTALVVLLLYALFNDALIAALVGLLFGVHPMTVEPVAWIGERKTLLATLFSLLCLIAYVRYARRPRTLPYAACLLLYLLALLSKPTSTPLPLVLLLLDFWPLKRFPVQNDENRGRLTKRVLVEKVPFLSIGAAAATITVISQGHAALSAYRELSSGQTLLLICHNAAFYLAHMIWPVQLSSFYSFPERISLFDPWLVTAVVTCLTASIVAVVLLYRARALLTGWLIFVVLLAPTLLNKSYSPSVAWDKYAYLPSLGLLLIIVWTAQRVGRRVAAATLPLIAVFLLVQTRTHLAHWQTTEGYCEYMLRLAPRSALLHHHRGLAYFHNGQNAQAIREYSAAIAAQGGYADAFNNRGNAHFSEGSYESAVRDYTQAIELLPKYAKAYNNRAVAYFMIKRYDQAWADVKSCRRAGGKPNPEFVKALAEASGRSE